MSKGLIIGGEFGSILVREKNESALELGELLVANAGGSKMLLQVFDLLYGSQLSAQHLELISGLKLEEEESLEVMDAKLRMYILAKLKNLALLGPKAATAKTLPKFFSKVEELKASDVNFLTTPKNALTLGELRSGSKTIGVPVAIDGRKALSHHVLVSGTTGRGKSVLMTNLLWNIVGKGYAGMLVFDPHDEYSERLRSHPQSDKVIYYTKRSPPPGARTLKVHIGNLSPRNFDGVVEWSDPQRDALYAYYNKYGEEWIAALLTSQQVDAQFHEGTMAVVKRRLAHLLSISIKNNELHCRSIFDTQAGKTTIVDIVSALDKGNLVIIDTSAFHGSVELLVGSMIASAVLDSHRDFSLDELRSMPVVSIVLEEAPRVLGKEVLERGQNVFSTIAREGRKFNVGLVAITQLPSLIPRDILANMNTKIILGIELKPERQAIIESAAQDLTSDERMIASLDIGEAIVTSNFLKFAMPLKIPPFEPKKSEPARQSFGGLKLA